MGIKKVPPLKEAQRPEPGLQTLTLSLKDSTLLSVRGLSFWAERAKSHIQQTLLPNTQRWHLNPHWCQTLASPVILIPLSHRLKVEYQQHPALHCPHALSPVLKSRLTQRWLCYVVRNWAISPMERQPWMQLLSKQHWARLLAMSP